MSNRDRIQILLVIVGLFYIMTPLFVLMASAAWVFTLVPLEVKREEVDEGEVVGPP